MYNSHLCRYYSSATRLDENWYKAWHAYAYMNFEAVLFWKNNQERIPDSDKRIGLVSFIILKYIIVYLFFYRELSNNFIFYYYSFYRQKEPR